MSDERVSDAVQSLWQSQPAAGGAMTLDELRYRAGELERRIRRRNRREYFGAAIVLPAFSWIAWIAPSPLARAGAVEILAATIFVVHHLSRHGATRIMPADMGRTGSLEFHRRELERQRDLLLGVWKWYVLPFAPGLILIYLAALLGRPEHAWRALVPFGATVVFGVFVGVLNHRAAMRIQAMIATLERG